MPSALPPATLEGWYALHQMFTASWPAIRALSPGARAELGERASRIFTEVSQEAVEGWSACFRLVGAGADWMFVHFRRTLEELADVELRIRSSPLADVMRAEYSYLSVAEAGLYHATADAARSAEAGSEEFRARLQESIDAELASPHVKLRLYPQVPEGMDYVSFYPMSKRRGEAHNWYALDVQERSKLMRDHGMTGRRYAGRIYQVITGSVGLDDWEWGVTLFARDPLDFKRIVTDMRYDEASSLYGEFGRFFTGIRFAPERWPVLLGAA